jgi:hypothetical protein
LKAKITVFLLAIIALSSAIYSQGFTSKGMYSSEKQGSNGAGTSETLSSAYVPGQFYKENFAGPNFPPQGWQTVDVQGAVESWTYTTIQYYSNAGGDARAARLHSERSESGSGEGVDWLISPQITVSSGDSLKFYFFCYNGYGTGSFAALVTEDESFTADGTSLNNSFTDTLVFQDFQTASNQQWDQYKASLEKYAGKKIYIGFKATNDGGSHINLDAVEIGTKPQYDMEASYINLKEYYQPGETIPLTGTFTNAGMQYLTNFDVNLEIPEAGKKYSAHYEHMSAYYSYYFSNWELTNADTGKYTLKMYVNAPGDQNISNDTLYKTFTVLKNADGMSWRPETPMSETIFDLSAAAYVKPSGSEAPDTTFLYAISGTRNGNSVPDIQKYNTITRLWETDTTLPGGVSNTRAFQVNGKIYILPGREIISGGTYYPRKLYIYDIEADTIGVGAEFPYQYAWYAAGLYSDSLIYVIGGDDQVRYSKAFLIYNIKNNKWTEGNPFANKGRGALSGTVCGDKIIIAGGATQDYCLADVSIGTINPDNPFDITWENETYPGGALEDITMGSWNGQSKKYVLFTGGHTNYGSVVSATSWAYDLVKKEWLGIPAKKTNTIYSSEMVPVVRNDSVFMAVLGGMEPGYVFSNANEWLYVCPSDLGMQKKDAAAFSVDFDTAAAKVSMVPKATFKNMRLPEASFTATMEITPGGYKSAKPVSSLAFDAARQVAFDAWIPEDVPEYKVKVYITLADDADKNNDTLTSTVKVFARDLRADGIQIGSAVPAGKEIFPKAEVYNGKEFALGCTATMKIMPGNYTSTKTVGSIPQYNSAFVEFDKWTPASVGKYTVTFYIAAAMDANTANDTLTTVVNVLEELKTGEWFAETSAPFTSTDKPSVFYTKKAANGTGIDTGYVFLVSPRGSGGKSLDMPIVDSSLIFNVQTQTWREAPTLPAYLSYFKAAYAGGKIYVPGGYSRETYSASNELYVYDVESNKWSVETPMPKAAAYYAIGVYGDSLIYVIGGINAYETEKSDTMIYHNGAQIYNVNTKTWKEANDFTGKFSMEHTGTILKNKIVVAGGTNPDMMYGNTVSKNIKSTGEAPSIMTEYSDQLVVGDINPSNPYSITWTASVCPGGAFYRSAVSSYETKEGGYVIFAGGRSENYYYLPAVLAFAPYEGKWLTAPDLQIPVSRANGVTTMRNDSVYFAAVGGTSEDDYEGIFQWLYLGQKFVDSSISIKDDNNAPFTYSLSQNYPNPFNPSTIIKYSVAEAGQVELRIYNILGQEVMTLVNEIKNAGSYEVKFNAAGMNLSSGVYLYRIKAGSYVQTKKLMLIK